ncbi:MAG TPA: nitroreductase/quinone reductase family protein [Solirubrobacteraceae bacterium]|nr:nitroreductase/quinone reductase family protein [Solirubrobacteraceae bacterium]
MARTPTLRHVDPDAPRSRLYLAVAKFSATDTAGWISRHLGWKVDPFLLRISNGRYSTATPLAAALLETTGARSGQRRRTATLYFHDGEKVTIIPSYRGEPQHPAWYHNIKSDPNVTFGGLPFRAAVVTDEDERRRLWTLAGRVYPAFAEFRERASAAGREIPIVQLTRR